MNLYIAGGCGEHGRNCFLLEGEQSTIMVDCGIGVESGEIYPKLTKEQIQKTKCLFLTHMHADHCGALSWLYKQGFSGDIYLSKETEKMIENNGKLHILPVSDCGQRYETEIKELSFTYGRSGHCPGAYWYLMEFEDRKVLFTGDYSEESVIYQCDALRNIRCDLAVIDCAYGDTNMSGIQNKQQIMERAIQCFEYKQPLLLPAPAAGRAVDLLLLTAAVSQKHPIYTDYPLENSIKQLRKQMSWIFHADRLGGVRRKPLKRWKGETGVLILSDPQLKKEESLKLAEQVLQCGGSILFTGYVYVGTPGYDLLKNEKAVYCCYPVHQNWENVLLLSRSNSFDKMVLNHCANNIQKVEHSKSIYGDVIQF